MYAEVRVFEDDGRPMMDRPYVVPASDIKLVDDLDKDFKVVNYSFKFVLSKLESTNQSMIDVYDREHAAYLKGIEEGMRRNGNGRTQH